jgi:hypothetical protein
MQLGTDKLDLDYVVLNKGLAPILIQELSAIQIATTDVSDDPYRNYGNGEICKLLPGIYLTVEPPKEAHPGRKSLHFSVDRPAPPPAQTAYGSEGFARLPDDNKLDVARYDPKALSESGKDIAGVAITIEAGKAASFAASFDTDPAAWGSHNVLILCGAIKYLRSDGLESWAVCNAWMAVSKYKDEKSTGVLGEARPLIGPSAVAVGSKESGCRVWSNLY